MLTRAEAIVFVDCMVDLRRLGESEDAIVSQHGDEEVRAALFSYWDERDPVSTVSGATAAKLFPKMLVRWEDAE